MGLVLEIQKIGSTDKIIIWIIVSLISTALFSFLDVLLFDQLFNINSEKNRKIKFVIISTILRGICILLIPVPFDRAFVSIITIYLFMLLFNKSIEKCVLGEGINALCSITIEILLLKFWINVFDDINSYEDGLYDYRYKFCLNISLIFFRSLIYCLIVKRNFCIEIREYLKQKDKIIILAIVSFFSFIIFLNTVEIIKYMNKYPYLLFVIDLISMIACFLVCVGNIVDISRLEEKAIQIQNLEMYNRNLTIMYDNLRGFKHDYANFIQSLNGYIQTNNMEGIRQMCNCVIEEYRNINTLGILDPDLINNAPIYSIITSKYYSATDKDIKMNIEVFIDFEEIQEEIYELCRVLAILLDNAIEAAKECDERVINIRFLKDEKVNRKFVIIENTYNEQDIDIGKIYEKGYTTKNDNNNEHGLGLWTVRKILSKSKKLNLYTTKEEMFCQKLEIYE